MSFRSVLRLRGCCSYLSLYSPDYQQNQLANAKICGKPRPSALHRPPSSTDVGLAGGGEEESQWKTLRTKQAGCHRAENLASGSLCFLAVTLLNPSVVESVGSFHRTDSRQDLGKSVGTLKLLDAAEKETDHRTGRSLPVAVQSLEHHLNSEHFLSQPFVVCTLIICFFSFSKARLQCELLRPFWALILVA